MMPPAYLGEVGLRGIERGLRVRHREAMTFPRYRPLPRRLPLASPERPDRGLRVMRHGQHSSYCCFEPQEMPGRGDVRRTIFEHHEQCLGVSAEETHPLVTLPATRVRQVITRPAAGGGLGASTMSRPTAANMLCLRLIGATHNGWSKTVAWAWRGNRRYYYRSVRNGRHVTKEYIGTGPVAERCAAMDAEQQAEREAQREAWRQQRAAMDAIDTQLEAWWDAGTTMIKAVLCAEGYYQHDRGNWRKRRPGR
jgi:hypothetical protein